MSPELCPLEPHWCPSCGTELRRPLPIEPMYSIKEAAAMLLKTPTALRWVLWRSRHEFRARYMLDGSHRKHRILTASEVRRLRDIIIREADQL
jgi:hypothetical protein